jgi:hypothetical protein
MVISGRLSGHDIYTMEKFSFGACELAEAPLSTVAGGDGRYIPEVVLLSIGGDDCMMLAIPAS